MRSDSDIKRDVEAELRFRPDIDERDIAVTINASSRDAAARPLRTRAANVRRLRLGSPMGSVEREIAW